MQVVREDLNPCTVRLVVTLSPEEVAAGFKQAYKIAAKSIRVPGFRPGQAPKAVLEKQVDKEALRETASEELVKKQWKKAVQEQGLEPYINPSVDVLKIEEEPPECEFAIKVPLKPIVELGDYKALNARRPKLDVSDAEVDAQLDELRRRKGERQTVTHRGAESGDNAVVNVKVDGEEGDGRNFMAVVGKTFPDLDALLIGMEPEQLRHAELAFPDDFQNKEWAGKQLACTISLRSLNGLHLPDLDDAFAQAHQAENVGELKNRISEAILRAKQEQSDAFVNEQLLENLVSSSKVLVPDNLWETVANQRLNDLAREQAESHRRSLEAYAKENGMSIQEFVEAVQAEARMYVIRAQAMQEIFVKEGMKLTNDDLNYELAFFAGEMGVTPRELVPYLEQNQGMMQEIQHRALSRKVTNFLKSHASIEEFDPAGA